MPKIDAYLRSIERFGATGALLVSGQSVTLRFPTGDRHATQVTPHDLLVALVREVAPAAAIAALEAERAVRFTLDSGGARFGIEVVPRAGEWQVTIDSHAAGAAAAGDGAAARPAGGAERPAAPPHRGERGEPASAKASGDPRSSPRTPMVVADADRVGEMAAALSIERTPFDVVTAAAGSGSALLDRLLAWARQHRATDLVLAAGAPAMVRVDGRWSSAGEQQALDADVLSRELGVMAPAVARAAWSERGDSVFATGDATGRMRVCLGRDAGGPRAIVRFLRAEPPTAEQLGVPAVALSWLRARGGVLVVAGGPGSGKSTTLAALVRELALTQGQAVATIEEPIELLHRRSALVSQREVGTHVASLAAGVRGAMREGVFAIAASRCDDAETAAAVAGALDAGHLVLLEVSAASAAAALARLTGAMPQPRGREALAEGLRGVLVQALVGRRDGGGQLAAFEVVPGGPELTQIVAEQHWGAVAELTARRGPDGAVSMAAAIAGLVQRGLASDASAEELAAR